MMRRTVGAQVVAHSQKPKSKEVEFDGMNEVVSTGSTLLDLAISGGRFEYGGIPGGILVEIFGPASCGKTVLLCELAGAIKRKKGEVYFFDPEARLNKQFAAIFDFEVDDVQYTIPDTIPQVFKPVRDWEPVQNGSVHGVFADSLAALSTEWEMDEKDQYGMRRAKEFSEQCRMTCRVLPKKNILMVCSNQVRQNLDAGPYGQKYKSPGGEAIGFYSSLRLRCHSPTKIVRKRKIASKDVTRIIGVETAVEIFKSSVWSPGNSAKLHILFDYGIDDIRSNLQFVKDYTTNTTYKVDDIKLDTSLDRAIEAVEEDGLQKALKRQTVELWREINEKFQVKRQPKVRQ